MKIAPFIPLKEVIFPGVITTIFVGRKRSIKSLEAAMLNDNKLLLFSQKNNEEESPKIPDGIYNVGIVANVVQSSRLPDGMIRVLIETEKRVLLKNVIKNESLEKYEAEYEEIEIESEETKEEEALKRRVLAEFESYLKYSNRVSAEILVSVKGIDDTGKLLDLIASSLNIDFSKRQTLLEALSIKDRGYKLLAYLTEEIEVLELDKKIDSKVRDYMSNLQKNYYLKEKIKVIKEEIGEESMFAEDTEDLRELLDKAKLPKNIALKMEGEISKLEKMPPYSSEFSVIRNYIETVLELPWNKQTKDVLDIKRAEKILEDQHFGLDEVKERILEFLAVKQLNKKIAGSILCLVGPPGVGKTSLSKSIAESLGRKFARISLGGVRDEAEIRGHRKTYIGAMPGRILKEIKQVESKNPVLLLDELDKMSSDFRGDPSSALLEVLDPEQNKEFVDHYLEVPFDLSNVFFIATANDASNIPDPLRDRLEIINITSYTDVEKLNIAKLYLISKSKTENGLKDLEISMNDRVLYKIINEYTKEAGVRGLKREIDKMFRKIAKKQVVKPVSKIIITEKNLVKYLGPIKFLGDRLRKPEGKIGVVNGLAWTPVGGSVLEVQSTVMSGKGKLVLTGTLGDVMKESAMVAKSYIRSIADELKIEDEEFVKNDIHMHFPEGATPKDGPSAGVTIVTSMISVFTKRPVRQDVGMTGEITITGDVLPVGGIKEKVIGAHRAGIREVILPKENKVNTEELPKEVKKDMSFHFVDRYEEIIDKVFTN